MFTHTHLLVELVKQKNFAMSELTSVYLAVKQDTEEQSNSPTFGVGGSSESLRNSTLSRQGLSGAGCHKDSGQPVVRGLSLFPNFRGPSTGF